MTPTDMMVADGDGNVTRAPEKLEQPIAEDPRVLDEFVRQEPGPSGLHWRIKLVDHEFSPHAPTANVEDGADANALRKFVERANALCNATDKAIAAARSEWADPSTLPDRLERIQAKAVTDAVALFRDTRAAAAEFVRRRTANTAPSPDDVATLDMGRAILRDASPADSFQWFVDAYHRGGRPWGLLRLLAARAGEKPPGHILGTEFQGAFAALAAMPYGDPASDSRAAREFAADVVNDVRRRLTHWSHGAASYGM